MPTTVVLIHGLWMTPSSWAGWKSRFEARGYTVLTPTWPRMEAGIEAIRADPSGLGGLGITEIVDHHAAVIEALPEPPIIMGHSFGGLFTQLLLDRGLGAAGVGIDAAQIKGVLPLPLSVLRSAGHILANPLNYNGLAKLSAEQFHWAFANTLSEADAKAVYDAQYIPGPAKPLFEGATANLNPKAASKVDVKRDDRAPLLLMVGSEDHIVPPAIARANHKLYRHSTAITELKEWPGRSHFIAGEPGWEEVADYALGFAERVTASPPPPALASEATSAR
jgi:pimeloyl-ACP methyl ester carboxylesterase